ncbi:MAG: hypothetical protein F4220_05115 [Gammaproteobacteria bacterium]|nr:hypothetical protein [Gammaproteobacteria bacterium]
MTDKNPPFQSAGKLRAKLAPDNDNPPLRSILFVPDTEHTVHHRLKTLALFVPPQAGGDARAIAFDDEKPIQLSVPPSPNSDFVRSVVKAAARQCCVDVEVVFNNADQPTIQALTVPAVPHRK